MAPGSGHSAPFCFGAEAAGFFVTPVFAFDGCFVLWLLVVDGAAGQAFGMGQGNERTFPLNQPATGFADHGFVLLDRCAGHRGHPAQWGQMRV